VAEAKKPLSKTKKTLIALVGAATVAICVPFVQEREGNIPKAYFDIVGVPTFCFGSTEGVTAEDVLSGRTYTREECRSALEKELVKHAEAVLRCTPDLRDHPNQLSSAISLAYNIGSGAYCKSTAARLFNAGDWPGACKAYKMWKMAGGKVIPGLVNRRELESLLCMTDLPPDQGGTP
jgi:lysozyme